ncbi:ribosome-associated peptidylprolyl cis-trans isomerase, FKBP-type (trigger factor) [Geotalea daltonii FRC-32]|uniref:Trigger factor n=1 Tax=Geotalea daltonii (strain DSM 22248 / JCM 15807 / FRC-32) TaxID=316067 RepID=TIG_GEODF|nr:trigger factor [Geotalea daltonii]B9M0Y0.1 RecName: Full=Trigger factor; Short=TF; AltName: Full=PPIase [Geotalea daltonii FRC-32]ACM20983.1 ribosome-associated peptidylprolyl cis-trans isomerase, FKBP-type (trigger factor) [Geotalea daltonii FRC-32]
MQISVESLSSVKKKINFEIPAARVASEVEKVYDEIRKHAAIKGFRKGKVPKDIIKKHYHEKMADDVLKNIVNDTYFKALTDEKIYPVSYPVIDSDELKVGENFKYSATVEVFPDVEVKDYDGLEVKKEKFVLNDEVVTGRLREMQENMAHLEPAEAGVAAKSGDYVTFDFKGSIDGVPFDGGAADDFQLELGSGRFIPGFEDQLVGMKSGDESEIKVTFPENYGQKDLAGKDASFTVKIKEIKVKELPELNDDFAKDFGEFETLEDLKKKIAEVHNLQENERIEADLRDRLIKALIEKNSFEVPETLVDKQLNLMLENSKRRLAMQRLTIEMMGLNDEGYKAQFRSAAETQVKGSILLDALARKESIEVTAAEVDEKLEQIAQQNNQDLEQVNKFYQQNAQAKENLSAQLKEDKAIELLLSKATVTEVERKELDK